jgi:predicted CopG family antitoxin
MRTLTIHVTNDAYYKLQKEASKFKSSPKVIAETWVSLYPESYKSPKKY